MQYTPEQVHLLAAFTLGDYARERETTKKVIAAVPAGQEQYRPDERSMTALKLAWHLASSEWWFLTAAASGEFAGGDGSMPDGIRTATDVLAWYEENVPPALAKARAMSGEALSKTLDMMGKYQFPAYVFLQLMLKHSVHHRGQLSAYLRPMGGKVPGIYGPSGDEK